MKRNEERYGTTYPNESSRSEQFHKPLHWTSSVSPEGVLAEGASFVEYAVPPWKVKKRMVSFRWRKESTSPAMLQKLIREHTEANYSTLKDDDLLTIPVNELKSTYDFEMRDVSKLEDRENWVARGQIHLTRRSDKALVAEYVGLAAAQNWSSNWEMVAVCIGPESDFVDGNRWKPLQFFFRRVVRLERGVMQLQ